MAHDQEIRGSRNTVWKGSAIERLPGDLQHGRMPEIGIPAVYVGTAILPLFRGLAGVPRSLPQYSQRVEIRIILQGVAAFSMIDAS